MIQISEYDKRQLQQMNEVLICFEDTQPDLDDFVSSMFFLYNAMESVDSKWEVPFLNEMNNLREINEISRAGVLAPEEIIENQRVIGQAIQKLHKLIEIYKTRISLREIDEAVASIILEKMTREEVSDWALSIALLEEKGELICDPLEDKEEIWKSLMFLISIDKKNAEGAYIQTLDHLNH